MQEKQVKKDTKKVATKPEGDLFTSVYIPSELELESRPQRSKQDGTIQKQSTLQRVFQRPQREEEEVEEDTKWELLDDVNDPPPKFWIREMEDIHDVDRSTFLHRNSGFHVSADEHKYDPKVAELGVEDEPGMLESRKRGTTQTGDKNEDAFRFSGGHQLGHLPSDDKVEEMRLYVNNQIQEQSRRYDEWKKLRQDQPLFMGRCF
ncbi:hypothetical protein RFI_08524, partial [Reticulomyxa filosa]